MSLSNHLAVQRNAFSTAVAAAKVCDGRTPSSIAERSGFARSSNNQYGEQIIMLIPQIASHDVVWRANKSASTGPLGPTDYSGDIMSAQWRYENVTTNGASIQKYENAPDMYRLVSAAMRISPINASESNQGWFEAIRVRPSWDNEHFSYIATSTAVPASGSTPATAAVVGNIVPSIEKFENGLILSSNWASDPSYVTGRLRELGKHTFYLQPTGPRNFKRWPKSVTKTSFSNFQEQPCGFDPDFDCIIVRIHSAEAPATSNTLYQSVHIHTVKNWETVYDGKTEMARFQTATISNEAAVKYTDKQMTRDTKASMIRSASSYAYKF